MGSEIFEIEKRVTKMLVEYLGGSELELKLDEQLYFDFFEKVEVLMQIEGEFNIEIGDYDVVSFKTVKDLINLVKKYKLKTK